MNFTKIDWLGFRTQETPAAALEGLRAAFGPVGPQIQARNRKGGWKGYTQSADVYLGGMHIGLMAYGGDNQKNWVMASISGDGCEWIPDWEEAESAITELAAFQPRRIDIALDVFKGESSHEHVVEAYRAGRFITSGKPPKMTCIIPEDPNDGRSAYVGTRSSDKFFRGYDKGREMAAGHPNLTHIDGVPIEDIYRLELELKAKTAPLPEDIIDKRDQYFAGAYPYLQSVLDVEPEVFMRRRERGPQLQLQAALANMRKTYGNTLFTALMAYQGDVSAVWDHIVGKEHNQKLVEAGALLVDHY
jgi:phage replication initiation protein